MMLTVPPIPADLEHLDGIRWRDRMRREIARMNAETIAKMRRACIAAVDATAAAMPKIAGDGEITSPLATLVKPGRFVEDLVRPLDAQLFPAFAETYLDNTYRISGVPRGKYAKPPKLDEPHHLDDPSPFLEGTPFAGILATPLPVDIPPEARTSHHWIVAGTGAGKTTALQYFIAKDLERAARGECSLIILDSQRQLVEDLWGLKLFAPGQPLDGKLCILDAADIEYPIALNLFDMRLDRLATLSPLDRERLTNSALEMYDFIIGSLLQAEMTSRQSTLFHFVTRALFAIPEATIHTFHDILKNGTAKYQRYIDTLDPAERDFFATDFNTNAQFKQTREQVNARLLAVLGNKTFLRMFSSPRSKIDLFTEINTPGKVILINAEKGLLKEEGTELFGRFFLGLINQAAAQRTSIPEGQASPLLRLCRRMPQLHQERSEDSGHPRGSASAESRRHLGASISRADRSAGARRAQREHRHQDGRAARRRRSHRDGARHEHGAGFHPRPDRRLVRRLHPRSHADASFNALP